MESLSYSWVCKAVDSESKQITWCNVHRFLFFCDLRRRPACGYPLLGPLPPLAPDTSASSRAWSALPEHRTKIQISRSYSPPCFILAPSFSTSSINASTSSSSSSSSRLARTASS